MTDSVRIIAYADCFSGAGGDMFLGAMLDLGLPEEILRRELAALRIEGSRLSIVKKTSASITATAVRVEDASDRNLRSWKDIRSLLAESALGPVVKRKSIAVFNILARAEAKVHGCSEEEVHFHEAGGLDTIIDVVGGVTGLVHLGIDRLVCSSLPMPRGWVRCDHGKLPVPAPAVCEILKGVPVYGSGLDMELVTPTGAALLKALSNDFGPFPNMTITGVGYGAGSRTIPDGRPNLLRLVIGTGNRVEESQEVEIIETHLDDWSPEGFPYLYERLFELGALDVILVPVHMKKGRPGFLLRVISDRAKALEIKRCILSETSALGLRYRHERRMTLPRREGAVATPWGPVRVKIAQTPGGGWRISPEYDDCLRVAREHGIPLQEVYAEVGRLSPETFRLRQDIL